MAAENTLLFTASAICCSSKFHLQNPDLSEKWWRSWPNCHVFLLLLLFLSHLFPSFIFFFHIIEDWSFVYVRLRGEFGPSFCQLFQNRFKVWHWLWAGALWHLASVQRFASGASIWDLQMTWAAPCSWQLRWFSNAHTVMSDMMWLGLQFLWWINWFILLKTPVALYIFCFCECGLLFWFFGLCLLIQGLLWRPVFILPSPLEPSDGIFILSCAYSAPYSPSVPVTANNKIIIHLQTT